MKKLNVLKGSVVASVAVVLSFSLIPPVNANIDGSPTQTQAAISKPSNLDDILSEAEGNNPRIKAALDEWQAARQLVPQARSFPDPQGRVGFFGSEIETRVGPQEARYGFSQTMPFIGKQHLRGKSAEKNAEIAEQKYEAVKSEILKEVKFTFFDIYWVDSAIEIAEEEKDILTRLAKSAERKYETGDVTQQDVFKAQAEISKILERLYRLNQQRESLRAIMNSLLNRPTDQEFPETGSWEIKPFSYSINELQRIAEENREELIAANLEIERSKYEKSLSLLDYFPDVTFNYDYFVIGDGHTNSLSDGHNAWTWGFSFNIPVWYDRLISQSREKTARLRASKSNFVDVENRVHYEVEDIYYKIISYKDIVDLYRTALIPQTEQAFRSSETGYQTGRVDFLNWLDSERVFLRTRLAYYKAVADYEKSIAYLERIAGKDLST